MDIRRLKDELPAIYENLLSKEFLEQPSAEPLATCNDCRMCKPQYAQPAYSPNVKCCSFYPFLPNYLVGSALKEDGEGATRIRAILRDRRWALPIGLVAPPSYQLKFNNKRPEEFGRNPDLLCPFYQKGNCAIWRHRNSECSTYFCAHEKGDEGKAKWTAIGQKLFETEMTLTQECMLEKGYSWPEVEENLQLVKITQTEGFKQYLNYDMGATEWARFWQHRADDPAKYFIECYEWVMLQPRHG